MVEVLNIKEELKNKKIKICPFMSTGSTIVECCTDWCGTWVKYKIPYAREGEPYKYIEGCPIRVQAEIQVDKS